MKYYPTADEWSLYAPWYEKLAGIITAVILPFIGSIAAF